MSFDNTPYTQVNSQLYIVSLRTVREMKRHFHFIHEKVLNGQNIDLFLCLEAEGSELWYQKPEADQSAAHIWEQ